MSITYHPQIDGQTEVMNRVLEYYMCSLVHLNPADWFNFLALAEWLYNTSIHSSTCLTPYEVIYGKAPRTIPHYIVGSSNNEVVNSLLPSRQAMHDTLRRCLLKAQNTMKLHVDTRCHDVTFDVGQWFYVKLQPFHQCSVTGVLHPKLSKWFFGPFQIL